MPSTKQKKKILILSMQEGFQQDSYTILHTMDFIQEDIYAYF